MSDQSMSDDCTMIEKAREAIEAGKLPNRRPDRTWAGPGVEVGCAICGALVRNDEVEYEIEFARNGDAAGVDNYHVHIRCFTAWQSAR
jgi:hypothetical protein